MKVHAIILFATALLTRSLSKPLFSTFVHTEVIKDKGDIAEDLDSRADDHRWYGSKDRHHEDRCPAEDPSLPPVEVAPPLITDGTWIWTSEVQPPNAGGTVPPGARPFVKVLHANCSVDHVTIFLDCDNFCTLYVNGLLVGTDINHGAGVNAQRYTVKFPPTHEVNVAIYAVQDPATKGAVGLFVSGVAWNSNQIKPIQIHFSSDSSWKTFPADDFDVRFIQPHFDVSDWADALQLGAYGVSPWGSFAVPTTPTAQNPGLTGVTGIPDAPLAGLANVVTLNGQ